MNPVLLLSALAGGVFLLGKAAAKPKPVGEYATQWARLNTSTQTILSELMMTDPVASNPSVSPALAWQQRMSQVKAWGAKLRADGFPAVAQTLEQRVSSAHQAATRQG